jgi:hypothetical protein
MRDFKSFTRYQIGQRLSSKSPQGRLITQSSLPAATARRYPADREARADRRARRRIRHSPPLESFSLPPMCGIVANRGWTEGATALAISSRRWSSAFGSRMIRSAAGCRSPQALAPALLSTGGSDKFYLRAAGFLTDAAAARHVAVLKRAALGYRSSRAKYCRRLRSGY